MADVFSEQKRSDVMRCVKSQGTLPELRFEQILRTLGLLFKKHGRKLPGRPDFLLPEAHLAVFVHGCFWHGHRGCRRATMPTSNRKYWRKKLRANKERDLRVQKLLGEMGWKHLVVWECQLKRPKPILIRLKRALSASKL